MKDSGGFLVVLFTVLVIVLIYRPPEFVKRPVALSVVFSLALFVDALFHTSKLFWDYVNSLEVIGAPTIRFGLVMVLVGAVLILYAVVQYYRESARNDELIGGK